jgi:hypothetical protein
MRNDQSVHCDLYELVYVVQGWNSQFIWTLGLPRGWSVKFLQETSLATKPSENVNVPTHFAWSAQNECVMRKSCLSVRVHVYYRKLLHWFQWNLVLVFGLGSGISSTPDVMVIPPWLGLLELGSGISSTPDVMVIPPWLGLLELGSGIFSTPDVMVIPPWLGLLELGSGISSTPDVMVMPPWLCSDESKHWSFLQGDSVFFDVLTRFPNLRWKTRVTSL